jgi:hypothetical protein
MSYMGHRTFQCPNQNAHFKDCINNGFNLFEISFIPVPDAVITPMNVDHSTLFPRTIQICVILKA